MRGRTLARPGARKSDEERILPLINVVFLLLIFVMVSSSLSAPDPFNTVPPISQSAGEADPGIARVIIAADGRLALEGEELELEALLARMRELSREDRKLSIQVQADGSSDSLRVVEVLEGLRELGVEQVKLITMQAAS